MSRLAQFVVVALFFFGCKQTKQDVAPQPSNALTETSIPSEKNDVGSPDLSDGDDEENKTIHRRDYDGDGTIDTLTEWSVEGYVSECELETSTTETYADNRYSIGTSSVSLILEAEGARTVAACVANAPIVEVPSPAFDWWLRAINSVRPLAKIEGFEIKTKWTWQTEPYKAVGPQAQRIPIAKTRPWMRDDVADPIDWDQIDAIWIVHGAVDSGGRRFEFDGGTIIRNWNHVRLERGSKWAWIFTSDAMWEGTNQTGINGVGFVGDDVWVVHQSDEAVPILWILRDGKQLGLPFLWKTKEGERRMDELASETLKKPIRVTKKTSTYVVTFDGTDVSAVVPFAH